AEPLYQPQAQIVRQRTAAEPGEASEPEQELFPERPIAERRQGTQVERHVPVQLGIDGARAQPLKTNLAEMARQLVNTHRWPGGGPRWRETCSVRLVSRRLGWELKAVGQLAQSLHSGRQDDEALLQGPLAEAPGTLILRRQDGALSPVEEHRDPRGEAARDRVDQLLARGEQEEAMLGVPFLELMQTDRARSISRLTAPGVPVVEVADEKDSLGLEGFGEPIE